METESDPSPAPDAVEADAHPAAPDAAFAPTPEELEAEIDEYGFDPAEFYWVPVLRKRRADGWSPQRQCDFIAALADTGSVNEAAQIAGMTRQSCYRLRREPGAEHFAAAWDAAIQQASLRLVDVAFDRAINGVAERVEYDDRGDPMEPRRRYNDRLLMFLLRAHQPERYRYANRDARGADEPALLPAPSLPAAMARLEPVTPEAPHLLTKNNDPVCAMQVAELLDGELAPWHREGPFDVDVDPFPLGIAFERDLARAKREGNMMPPQFPPLPDMPDAIDFPDF
jgi:hypothetical protein